MCRRLTHPMVGPSSVPPVGQRVLLRAALGDLDRGLLKWAVPYDLARHNRHVEEGRLPVLPAGGIRPVWRALGVWPTMAVHGTCSP